MKLGQSILMLNVGRERISKSRIKFKIFHFGLKTDQNESVSMDGLWP